MIKQVTLTTLLLAAPANTNASDYTRYRAEVVRTVDGDTVDLSLYLGLDVTKLERVRLLCVDTPETHGAKAKKERAAGLVAQLFADEWFRTHQRLIVRVRSDNDRDVYGRLLITLFGEGDAVSLNEALLNAKMGVLLMCKSIADLDAA